MYNVAKKNELMEVFRNAVDANVQENLSDLNLKGFCDNGKMDLVKKSCEKVRANVTSAIPVGCAIPKASMYVNGTGNGSNVTILSISLTNGWKDEKKFKFSLQIPVGDNILEKVIDFYKAAYETLLLDDLAENNLSVINDMYAEFAKEAGLSYTVKLVTPLSQNGKKIAYIADDSIEFVVDLDRVFDVDDILVLQAPSELISEEQIENAKTPLIEELGSATSTVQLAGSHGGSLIKWLCNIGTQVKAITMIRKVNSKNMDKLTGSNDTTAYYEKDDVYAVVARREGKFEIILKPFNVKTLETVDVDVLAS